MGMGCLQALQASARALLTACKTDYATVAGNAQESCDAELVGDGVCILSVMLLSGLVASNAASAGVQQRPLAAYGCQICQGHIRYLLLLIGHILDIVMLQLGIICGFKSSLGLHLACYQGQLDVASNQ